MDLLSRIDSPTDLRKLSLSELERVAAEVRAYVISVVTEIGGHLGASLGALELTIALHYVFDTPDDRIVWDVGHQAYVHKVLTGRREALKGIRHYGGISGFPRRSENPYDAFGVGHAGTSVSAGLGIAKMRDLLGKAFRVVVVIGDGGLTSGLSYEGLDNSGISGTDLLVVLNDNSMAISPNVGAISSYLTRMLTDPLYNRIKREVWDLTGRIPSVGEGVRTLVGRIDESLKNMVTPGILFEELGFRYIGPIDGHDLKELVTTLRNLKRMKGPVLLHTITEKARGMDGAQEEPHRYHSVGPAASRFPSRQSLPKYTDVFGRAMVELGERDTRVVAITAAMSNGTGLDGFAKRFPDRFFDVGIAEQHAVTFAAGLAAEGGRPVVAIYSTFLQRAFDQIVHDVALQSLPVVFAIDRGGLAGEDGPTHHGAFDLSYLSCIPNLVVAAPKDGDELRDLLYTAVLKQDRPFAIRYPKDSVPCALEDRPPDTIPVGSFQTLLAGDDLVIIAIGAMVDSAVSVANCLSAEGLSVGVVNGRFAKPVDLDALGRLGRDCGTILTLEENALQGGFGDAVAQGISSLGLDGRVRLVRLGLPDSFVEHGPRDALLDDVGLSVERIAAVARRLATGSAVPAGRGPQGAELSSFGGS